MTLVGGIGVREVAPTDWPVLASSFADYSYEQDGSYVAAAAARQGAEARFFAVEENGRVLAAAAVRLKRVPGLGRGIAWIASGPMTCRPGERPDPARVARAVGALKSVITDKERHVLRFRLPLLPPCENDRLEPAFAALGALPTSRAKGYHSLALDLAPEPSALRARLHGKWRTDLNAAERSGLRLEAGKGAAIEARFLALFEMVKARKGFETEIGPDFFFALEDPHLVSEVLIATTPESEDAAGIVVTRTGGIAVYHFGATGPAGRKSRAGYFLNWQGILRSRAAGAAWYDLGGIDREANPDVYRFKSRTGAVELHAAGPFEVTPGGALPVFVHALEDLRERLRGQSQLRAR